MGLIDSMLTLPTEIFLLERLPRETGLSLSSRIYGEDFLAKASVDDLIIGKSKPEFPNIRKMFEGKLSLEEIEAMKKSRMPTEAQSESDLYESENILRFFTRTTYDPRKHLTP